MGRLPFQKEKHTHTRASVSVHGTYACVHDCASERALTVTGRGACNLLRNGYPESVTPNRGDPMLGSSHARVCARSRVRTRDRRPKPFPVVFIRRGGHVTARQSDRRHFVRFRPAGAEGARMRSPRAKSHARTRRCVSRRTVAAEAVIQRGVHAANIEGTSWSSRGIDLRRGSHHVLVIRRSTSSRRVFHAPRTRSRRIIGIRANRIRIASRASAPHRRADTNGYRMMDHTR